MKMSKKMKENKYFTTQTGLESITVWLQSYSLSFWVVFTLFACALIWVLPGFDSRHILVVFLWIFVSLWVYEIILGGGSESEKH